MAGSPSRSGGSSPSSARPVPPRSRTEPAVGSEAIEDPLQLVRGDGHVARADVDVDRAVRVDPDRELVAVRLARTHGDQPAAVAPVNENDDIRSDGTTLAPRNPRDAPAVRLTASTLARASR